MAFTPDTKDWTWVITQRCPECGFDGQTVAGTQVATRLRENAAQWRQVLGRPDVQRRPGADIWSPLEYACHVRDVCIRYLGRLDLMLTQDDPLYENWDQDATAVELRYAGQPPAAVADELDQAAAAMADRLDDVTGPGWQRPGRRSDGASFTIETLSRYFLHDVVHHLWDVRDRGPN
jgi:DinB superfamily